MPRAPYLLAALFLLGRSSVAATSDDVRLLFGGDVLLAREVAREMEVRQDSEPLKALQPLFSQADWVAANLEGAVGESSACPAPVPRNLCFTVGAPLVSVLHAAGVNALFLENNHRADAGAGSREATAAALKAQGLAPLRFETAPTFVTLKGKVVAIVPVTLVPDVTGASETMPSPALARKLALARALSHLVVVSVHWGAELVDWPQLEQRRQAQWLVDHGADLIVGHHPHVVVKPECVGGAPVFYSLGNLLFDQKYPQTKNGLLADCSLSGGRLRCGAQAVRTPANSAFPQSVEQDPATTASLAACRPALHAPLSVNGITLRPWPAVTASSEMALEGHRGGRGLWRTPRGSLLGLGVGTFETGGTPWLFTLEAHFSTIDAETGPRPYVYRVEPGGLVALWRGSALAWPIIHAELLPGRPDRLCVLHRGDSFVTLDPSTQSTKIAVYDWSHFGFKATEDRTATDSCRQRLGGRYVLSH